VIQGAVKEVVARLLPERGTAFSRRALDVALETHAHGDVVIIGPGLGRGPIISETVFYLLEKLEAPMVLDADALNAISEDVNVLKRIKRNSISVITPHPGEMSRLTGLPVRDILENTIRVAVEFSREFDVVTVLKDARVIVASPTGHTYINTTGSNALSKGGTGDALTGVIAGFMAQGLDAFTAARLGAYIHGKAGDIAAQTLSHYGVMATDVVETIPTVLLAYEKKRSKQ
jgi:NAD(P)H-hydrate epimerase